MGKSVNDMTPGERAQHYHNEGQEDASKGNDHYNQPHDQLGPFSTLVNTDKDIADKESYNTGWRKGRADSK